MKSNNVCIQKMYRIELAGVFFSRGIEDSLHVIGIVGSLPLDGLVAVFGHELPEGLGDEKAFAAVVHDRGAY